MHTKWNQTRQLRHVTAGRDLEFPKGNRRQMCPIVGAQTRIGQSENWSTRGGDHIGKPLNPTQ